LYKEEADEVLLQSLDNIPKLKHLLNKYSPLSIVSYILSTDNIAAQVELVRKLTLKEIRPYLDLVKYHDVGIIIEDMGHTFNINRSIDLNLIHSATEWVGLQLSKAAVEAAIKYALQKYSESLHALELQGNSSGYNVDDVFAIICSIATKEYLQKVILYCVAYNLSQPCIVLANLGVNVNEALNIAIKSNKLSICKALAKYATKQHITLANNLNRNSIYNVFIAAHR